MTEEYWFQTEEGIKARYAEELEAARIDFNRKTDRIAFDRDAMITALRASKAPKGRRDELGMVMNDGQTFTRIGKRKDGSFRSALKRYGFDRKDIDRVIADLDCDREMTIDHRGNRFHLRPL